MLVIGAPTYYRRVLPEALRQHFEIVFCDTRAWVPSPSGFDVSTITRTTYAEDLAAVQQAAGLDRPVVLGHSVHGTMALDYAARYPTSVRGVVAVAAPVGGGDGLESAQDFFKRDARADRVAAHERNQDARRLPGSITTSQDFIDMYVSRGALAWFDPEFDSSHLWQGVEVNLPVTWPLYEPDLYGGYELERLEVPAFVALGRYDYGVPFFQWDEPKRHLSNLFYKLYDRSGHTPPYEQPEEFTADIVGWVGAI